MNCTSNYRHLISIDGQEPENTKGTQTLIQAKGATHVRAMNGKIWRIFGSLNAKSVPLNNAGDGPPRLAWAQVESFGTVIDKSGGVEL